MKFKNLPLWAKFKFDTSALPEHLWLGIPQPAWIKTGTRSYLPADTDATTNNSPGFQVGSVNTKVVKL